MGSGNAEALGSVRLSLGRKTSLKDVERAAADLERGWRQLVKGD